MRDADPGQGRDQRGLARDAAIVLGAFVLVTVVAVLAGAANLGTALGVGQVGFVLALTYALLRR